MFALIFSYADNFKNTFSRRKIMKIQPSLFIYFGLLKNTYSDASLFDSLRLFSKYFVFFCC